eukprot:gnl/TRDRNA2_/TRDRNA2_146702_c1_seq1.p1 gnl/TRDRNA2_/TRDRNA2_146702_c1~~gnl/TRDRNA2_/TRDRNA2_146702_c1_seq1.p1  ORF type:complete len:383 (+),score=52.76 gnl/TRDRNA2_/TRDRNA2_146702_c1_seq1:2-1150(+)
MLQRQSCHGTHVRTGEKLRADKFPEYPLLELSTTVWAFARIGYRSPALAFTALRILNRNIAEWVKLPAGQLRPLGRLLWGLVAMAPSCPGAIEVLKPAVELHLLPRLQAVASDCPEPDMYVMLIWAAGALCCLTGDRAWELLKVALGHSLSSNKVPSRPELSVHGEWEQSLLWEVVLFCGPGCREKLLQNSCWAELLPLAWVRERCNRDILPDGTRPQSVLDRALNQMQGQHIVEAEVNKASSSSYGNVLTGILVDAVFVPRESGEGSGWCIEVTPDEERSLPPATQGACSSSGSLQDQAYGASQLKRQIMARRKYRVIDVRLSVLARGHEATLQALCGALPESVWPSFMREPKPAVILPGVVARGACGEKPDCKMQSECAG